MTHCKQNCKRMLHYKYAYTLRGHHQDVSWLPCLVFSYNIRADLLPQVRCVASTHSGGLVSASRDCSARLWTGSEGKVDQSGCLELIGHEKFCVSCCAIPPCARFPAGAVASGSMDSSIVIWDNAEPAITLLGHTEQVPLCCLPSEWFIPALIPWRSG